MPNAGIRCLNRVIHFLNEIGYKIRRGAGGEGEKGAAMLERSREFMELAARLNYTAAAYRLNISQPSLSRHIAELEQELGFKLFERKPLSLTPAGRYYMESVSDIIERLDAVIDRGRCMDREGDSSLSICMVPSEGPYSSAVYETIARMRISQPDFSPRFHFDRSRTVLDAVCEGSADVGILLNEPIGLPDDIVCEWLMDSPFDAWLHEDNPVLKNGSVRFEDLADCSLVCSTNQQYRTWYDGMVGACRKRGMDLRMHLKDLDDMTCFLLGLRPDEVLFGSDSTETCPCNPRLVRIRFDDPDLFYSAYLTYREPARPIIRKFIDTCHRVAEERS